MTMREKIARAIAAIFEKDFPARTRMEWDSLSRPAKAAMLSRADAALDTLGQASADDDAIVAQAIAAEFDLELTERPNSEFMDFIAAAKAARLAMIKTAKDAAGV